MTTDQNIIKEITISHIDNNGAIQSNEEHQRGVAQRAERFAAEFGMGDCGRLMGLLHDKGKEQKEWQEYIQCVTNIIRNPHVCLYVPTKQLQIDK
jgi:CRISPR-associated endonuclease/helicase Cas3